MIDDLFFIITFVQVANNEEYGFKFLSKAKWLVWFDCFRHSHMQS